tara:strand:+ start:23013 stop:23606 length:594 start_codon:yes stop_codon:yes gene_type:complete
MKTKLKISENRSTQKYSTKEMAARILWIAGLFVFKLIPRPLFGIRCRLARCFGASIGADVHIYPSATIYFPWNLKIGNQSAIGENALVYNLGAIVIGERVTISQRAHLCGGSHDYTDPTMPLLKTPIQINDDAWVCADAFVGPGVTIGEGAVVGARAVVTKDVPPWTVVAGNPAKEIRKRHLMSKPDPASPSCETSK